MESIRYLSQSLTKNDYPKSKEIIDSIDISQLDNRNKKGFISLLMRYYEKTDNIKEMTKIIYSDFKLMKRDYLLYCKAIYHSNVVASVGIFKEHVLFNEKIQSSDIDFLIENNLIELIKSMNGYYITCSKKSKKFDYSHLKKFSLTKNKDKLIEHFKKDIPENCYTSFIKKINSCDIIIDGGNVYHYTNPKNFTNIEKMLSTTLENYKNPVIIFHQRHFKSAEGIEFYSKYQKYIFKTPYNVYDDIFIILGMMIKNIPIVTNDLFRDHIYVAFKLFESKNNQIANYINEMKLSFSINSNNAKIEKLNTISKCIQFNSNYIYIPTIDGFYVMNI